MKKPIDNFKTIEGLKSNNSVIFEAVVGSHSYGTNTPDSDIDIKGVFVLPVSFYLSIFNPPEEVTDGTEDYKLFEIKKFINLASTCNPTVIELFWSPQDCIRISTPIWEEIRKNRNLFISKKALNTFSGYAYDQIKKATGQNKMVMKEWTIDKPTKEDFCWFIPHWIGMNFGYKYSTLPGRPIPIKEAGLDLKKYNVAALEHVSNTYRLYYYGNEAKGVFRGNDMLAVESIPISDECDKLHGFLIYNKDAYNQALKDHTRYWTWRKERNESRWKGQDGENFKYDRKNMMHCMRLVLSGKAILETGEPIIRFEGEKLKLLQEIRAGKYEYEEIMSIVEMELEGLKSIANKSSLQDSANLEAIDNLFVGILGKQLKNDE